MNSRMLLLAVAGIDESYVRESERSDEVAAEFRANRIRKRRAFAAAGAAAVVCAAVLGVMRFTRPLPSVTPPSESSVSQTADRSEPSSAEEDPAVTAPGAAEKEDAITAPTGEPTAPVGNETSDAPSRSGDVAPSASTVTPDRPPATAEPPSTEKSPDRTTSPPVDAVPTAPPAARPTDPSAENPTDPPAARPTDPPSGNGDPGGTPGAVFTKRSVGYEEAKAAFAHPIVPCYDGNFTGYQVGIVSRNGDVNADGSFCLSVDYTFSDGHIGLTDQDRLGGSSASTLGEVCEYRGRTFYVQTPDDYGSYGADSILVGYYPTWDSGIAYQAVFDTDADIYEIMDRMIAVEMT